jgi:hydroxymethylglutaryl-CoA synthase
MDITVNDALIERRANALSTQDYINRRTEIDYATYARQRGKLVMR